MRSLRAIPEVALVLVTAALVTLLLQAIVEASNFHATSIDAKALGPLWAAIMIALAAGGYLIQRSRLQPSAAGVAVLAGIAGGVVMLPMLAGLHGTPQPLNTVLRGDMVFRTEYVTRFASTWRLQDYTFRGLHAFYPPAWFWLAGRSAHLLHIAPWRIVKPFTIGTTGVALLLAFGLWRAVLTPAGALAAAIGSSLVLTTEVGNLALASQSWYEPYSCLVAITGAAWVAATLVTARRPGWHPGLALLTVVGALLALSYYLLFIILALVLVVLAAVPAAGRRHALARVGACLGVVGLLTAVFWVPLLSAVLGGNAAQGHYVQPEFLRVAVGLNGPALFAALSTVAIVALAATFYSTASQAVAGLIAGTIVYQLASVASLVFTHNQLQPHRAVTMMWATFGAAVPVAFDQSRRVPRLAAAAALALAIPATFALGASEGSDLAGGPLTVEAHDPVNLRPSSELSRYITGTTGKSPQDLTLLTEDHALLATRPYHDFLPLRARYAHPEAHVSQRVAVVRAAAACPTAACTARALGRSRFGAVQALVLARVPGGFRVTAQLDGFPDPIDIPVYFRHDQLPARFWLRHRVGGYTVFVRRSGTQLRAVPKVKERSALRTALSTSWS